jgi:hypothetical protein
VSVTIGGLTSYETLTDNLDQTVFSGNSVTLSAAEVNSGLTLSSSYTGTGHPANNLTFSASDSTQSGAVTSAPQTIVVTDPPVIGSSPPLSILPTNPAVAVANPAPPYTTLAALLNQYMAASPSQGAAGISQTPLTASQPTSPSVQLLTKPLA